MLEAVFLFDDAARDRVAFHVNEMRGVQARLVDAGMLAVTVHPPFGAARIDDVLRVLQGIDPGARREVSA